MQKLLTTYYSSLYAIKSKETHQEEEIRKVKIQEYLADANLPKISLENPESLDEPITQEEVYKAIKETPGGESPGPDGSPMKYYKRFKKQLVPVLCDYFNKLGENEEIRRESLLANISIIPKVGKDKTLCSNYRPIAFLNADIKLYAKILATRLKNHMPELINVDQVGFVPRREGRDNSIRTLLIMNKGEEIPNATHFDRCRKRI